MPENVARSLFGYNRGFTGVTVEGLGNVLTTSVENTGDILVYDDDLKKWVAQPNSSNSSAIVSIADLTTSRNEMLYTTATDTYATSIITAAGRGLVSVASSSEQRALIGVEPGVDVQTYSGSLDNIIAIGNGAADFLVYTTGSGFSNTALSSFMRTTVLPAATAGDLATAIGSFTGTASTTSAIMRVTGTNTLSESGATIDASDNLAGVNDAGMGGDLTVTGTINGAASNAFTQITNINGNTISSTQWGYLAGQDQAVDTSATPTFVGANMGSALVSSVLDPVSGQDAATKAYVDTVAATGAPPLQRVQLATAGVLPDTPSYASGAQTLTSSGNPGSLTVDGVATAAGNRILVKDQATVTQNGVYVVTSTGNPGSNYVLTRATDFNQAAAPIAAGASIFAEINGSAVANSGTTWALRATATNINPLTDDVEFVQLGGIATFSAGSGIDATQLAASTIQADITARLKFTGTELDLNTVTVGYGGTGATTLATGNVLVGQGTSAIIATKAAPTGTFVGTSDAQTLTNKVATAATNDLSARRLFVGSGAGTVSTYSATAPSSGQVLTATAATTATWQTPATAAFAPDRTLFVYQSAGDVSPNWSTLEAAITDAASLTPTAANPMIIVMYPGTYSEATPLTIPPYVTVSGIASTQSNVVIRPTAVAPTAAVIRMGGNARMYGIIVDGFDGGSAYATIGIECVAGTAYSIDYCNSVTVRNCTTANFLVTGNTTNQYSKILVCHQTSALVTAGTPFVCAAGYKCELGGVLTGTDFTTSGFLSGGGEMTRGVYVLNDYSLADISTLQISSCVSGLAVGGGTTNNSNVIYPRARVSGCRIGLISEKAIEMLAKSDIYLAGLITDNDAGIYPNQLDVHITNPALPAEQNILSLYNSISRISKISLLNGAANNPSLISGLVFSNELGDNQSFFLSSLVIGYPLMGQELVVGEGNSHSLTMIAKTDDGGVFIDETSQLNTATPSTNDVDIATTAVINLASAPATIDGVAPVTGTTRVLVKDGSTANTGTDSVDNGVYIWNGAGSAMTRATDFPAGEVVFHATSFSIDTGDTNYGERWRIDATSFTGELVTIGTTSFALEASSATPFPLASPADDDVFYIGSSGTTSFRFPGLKMTLTKPLTLSSGTTATTLAWEYWNGAAWDTLPIMSTHGSSPYESFASTSMGFGDASVGNPSPVDFQIRFGLITDWATTAVDGDTGYWVRCRLLVAANINQMPVISRIKIHTNRSEINKDGFHEFFGAAEPVRVLSIASENLCDPGNGSSYTNPGAQRLVPDASGLMSLNIDRCQMNNGINTAHSYVLQMPEEMDTSKLLKMKVSFAREDTSSGNVAIRVLYCTTSVGTAIGVPGGTPTATTQDTGIQVVAVASSGTPIQEYTFTLDLTAHQPNTDLLWLQFSREGTNGSDTFGGDIYVFKWTLCYHAWCLGHHDV